MCILFVLQHQCVEIFNQLWNLELFYCKVGEDQIKLDVVYQSSLLFMQVKTYATSTGRTLTF